MKKVIKFFTILWVLFSAAGCIHENYGNCPVDEPFNITLDFLLPDGVDGCKFMSNVSAVDLHIYDDNQKLVETIIVTPEQLKEYKGVKLMLPAGTYNVVGWGNINEGCIFHDANEDDDGDPYESTIAYDPLGDRFGYTSGKIYYAPRSGAFTRSGEMPGCYTMNVDPETGHRGTLEFRPAHRIFKVYVEGYEGIPMIEFIGLPMGLSWLGMGQLTGSSSGIITTIMKTTVPYEKDGIVYDYVEFDTFHFDGGSEITLQVISPETLDAYYSVLLNDVIEEIHDPEQIEVYVLVKFTPVGVEVSIPEWHRKDVDPGVSV